MPPFKRLPLDHYTKAYALSDEERVQKEFKSNILRTSAVAGTARAAVKLMLARGIRNDPGVLKAHELARATLHELVQKMRPQ